MTTFVGFVAKINKVTKKSQKTGKPFTLWSFRASNKDGEEIDHWFNCAFDKPDCQEGDYIKFEANPSTKREGNYDVVVPSIQVSKNPPANPTANKPSVGGGAKAAPKASDLFGEIGGYNTEDDIRRMSYTAARTQAIEVAELLIDNGGIKLKSTNSKAGIAANFDIILGLVDKLTVEYFYDAATGRKLEVVADSFETLEGDGALPDSESEDDGFADDPEDEFADDEEFEDDIPFE